MPLLCCPAMSIERATNVLIIAIDTQRADHLSCYGYPRLTSPTSTASPPRGPCSRRPTPRTSPPIPAHHPAYRQGRLRHQIVDPGGQARPGPRCASWRSSWGRGATSPARRTTSGAGSSGLRALRALPSGTRRGRAWRKAEAVNAPLLPLLDEAPAPRQGQARWRPSSCSPTTGTRTPPTCPPAPFHRHVLRGRRARPGQPLDGRGLAFAPVRQLLPAVDGRGDRHRLPAQYDARSPTSTPPWPTSSTAWTSWALAEDTLVLRHRRPRRVPRRPRLLVRPPRAVRGQRARPPAAALAGADSRGRRLPDLPPPWTWPPRCWRARAGGPGRGRSRCMGGACGPC